MAVIAVATLRIVKLSLQAAVAAGFVCGFAHGDCALADPTKPAKTHAAARVSSATSGEAIAVLVNDDPITNYEIEQRQKFLGLTANVGDKAQASFKAMLQAPGTTDRLKAILNDTLKGNQGKSKEQIIAIFEERKKQFALSLQKQAVESARASVLPELRKSAMDELIEERLKLQAAKKLNVIAQDDEVEKLVASIAERNKMTIPQFSQHLKGMGADLGTMRQRFKSTLSWNNVIRQKFGYQVQVSQKDVDRYVAHAPGGAGADEVALQLQRITLPIASKLEQKAIARQLQEADALHGKFSDCKSMAGLASSGGARFEDLGEVKSASLPEPTRSLLLNAQDGQMLPPAVAQAGVELWAVCGRKTLKGDEQKRSAAQDELRQKEFELYAKRHLNDLRQDANIEYR